MLAAKSLRSSRWFAVCSVALFASCASTGNTRWSRHSDGDVWSQGFQQQLAHPEQLWPAATLLAATPLMFVVDDDIKDDSIGHHYVTGGVTSSGDSMAALLGVGALGFGSVEALAGDDSRSLEVGAEALLATDLVTELLKRTTGRSRPLGGSNDSFPSGHTSFAFAGATFIARRIDALVDGPWGDLGYALYLPATFVAVDRLEGGRHWASDVAFGAFLGVFVTNWVYNAHYGDENAPRASIFRDTPRAAWSVGPAVIDGVACISVGVAF